MLKGVKKCNININPFILDLYIIRVIHLLDLVLVREVPFVKH
jgi:hypothetical protein